SSSAVRRRISKHSSSVAGRPHPTDVTATTERVAKRTENLANREHFMGGRTISDTMGGETWLFFGRLGRSCYDFSCDRQRRLPAKVPLLKWRQKRQFGGRALRCRRFSPQSPALSEQQRKTPVRRRWPRSSRRRPGDSRRSGRRARRGRP